MKHQMTKAEALGLGFINTNVVRNPVFGEYYFCGYCKMIEYCKYPEHCGEGEIWEKQ